MYDLNKIDNIETEKEIIEAIEGLIEYLEQNNRLLLEVEHPKHFEDVAKGWGHSLFFLMCLQQRAKNEDIDVYLDIEEKVFETISNAVETWVKVGNDIMSHEEVTQKTIDRILDTRKNLPELLDHLEKLRKGFDKRKELVEKVSDYDSTLEDKWKVYFNELNIEYRPNEEVTLNSGIKHTFSFFLPELECLVEVVGPPITNSHHNKLLQTVFETETPVVFIEGSPNFRFYEMIIPQGGENYDVKAVNIIQEGKKFVEFDMPMDTKGEFEQNGYSEAISAVKKVNKWKVYFPSAEVGTILNI